MADFDSTKTYFVKGASLKRLADIVREKIGQNIGMTLEQMGNYIYTLKSTGDTPTDGILVTGDASYLFIDNIANSVIEQVGHRMTTSNLTDVSYMFAGSGNLTSFPFVLNAVQPLNASGIFKNCASLIDVSDNLEGLQGLIKNMNEGFYSCQSLERISGIDFDNSESHTYDDLCKYCHSLKEIGYLKDMKVNSLTSMFEGCRSLKEFPEIINFDASAMHNKDFVKMNRMFNDCYSLRSVPEDFLKEIYSLSNSYRGVHLAAAFENCCSLDEIRGLSPKTGTVTGEMGLSFSGCVRVKDLIFDTQEDGTPYEVEWAGQNMDLSQIGYGQVRIVDDNNNYQNAMLYYNSGITSDKRVTDDTSYQALKDDPDWYTTHVYYSRYNHDSAVRTINSLPDTSVFVASMTGGGNNPNYYKNYIQFNSMQGQKTDGGKIGNLTEAEIAVAVAKGWTVTFTEQEDYI